VIREIQAARQNCPPANRRSGRQLQNAFLIPVGYAWHSENVFYRTFQCCSTATRN
jgi:hypothetical protein